MEVFFIELQYARQLAIDAEKERGHFDYASAVCASNLQAGQPLSPPLLNFVLEVLTGRYPVPAASRRDRNWSRDLFLLSTVQTVIRKFGLTPSRNQVATRQESAIDAVIEGMRRAKLTVEYDVVKRLTVGRGKDLQNELNEFDALLASIGRREFILRLPGTDPADPPWRGESERVDFPE